MQSWLSKSLKNIFNGEHIFKKVADFRVMVRVFTKMIPTKDTLLRIFWYFKNDAT